MPVVIFREKNLGEFEKIDQLCETSWSLADQLFQLETWMDHKGKKLQKGSYYADLGFSIEPDTKGGGPVLTVEFMKKMTKLNMDLYFSEYP